MARSTLWRRIRAVWVTVGITVTVIFAGWSLLAYRASGVARQALQSSGDVRVSRSGTLISFLPGTTERREVELLFFAGSLVDPVAYAPLARAVAKTGVAAHIVALPRRGAFGGADDPRLYARVDSILRTAGEVPRYVIGGHSRGGVVASKIAAGAPEGMAGLVLVGTSHPRDVDLSRLEVPVLKIVGTRDGLARPGRVRANAHLLPAQTVWTWVEGGNHSQFGWYGFQPGDRLAAVSRADQQGQMVDAVLAALRRAEPAGIPRDAHTHPAPGNDR